MKYEYEEEDIKDGLKFKYYIDGGHKFFMLSIWLPDGNSNYKIYLLNIDDGNTHCFLLSKKSTVEYLNDNNCTPT